MKQTDLFPYLAEVPLEKAFYCEGASAEALATELFALAEARLTEEGLSVSTAELTNMKLVYADLDDPEYADYLRAKKEADEDVEVNPHLFVRCEGASYKLWGKMFCRGGVYRGKLHGFRREAEPVEPVKPPELSWLEVAAQVGVVATPELQRWSALVAESAAAPARAETPSQALYEPGPLVRPDMLPLLRMPDGDQLSLRFDGQTGEVIEYALWAHETAEATPLGTSLAAALGWCAAEVSTLGGELSSSWGAAAEAVASGEATGHEEVVATVALGRAWYCKLELEGGVAANSEAVCREWLEVSAANTGAAFVNSSRFHTYTAFAAARLGDREQALRAAVAALRLPAWDGEPSRSAVRLLDELGAPVPEEFAVLARCLREAESKVAAVQSVRVRSVQRSAAAQSLLAEAAAESAARGDHAAAVELLLRANYDVGAVEEPALLAQLLTEARAAGYEPLACVLAARLGEG